MSKVSFDPILRIINLTVVPILEGSEFVVDIDIQTDIYSQGKIDWIANESLRRLAFPVRATGGDPLPGSKELGDTYFLASDWKIAPFEANHRLRVNGNFYSEDGTSPFNRTTGSYNVFLEQTVSSLVDSTVQQLEEIENSTYNGGVTIDQDDISGNAQPGIAFPTGSPGEPSNNLLDTHLILVARTLPKKLYIFGNLMLGDEANWQRHEFIGESAIKSLVTITPAANVANCEFYDCTITGTLDGNSHIERSVISNLTFVDGYVFRCALGPGIITLGTNTIASIWSCYSTVPGSDAPVIDMNGTGILTLRDYKGSIHLKNYSGSSAHTVALAEGNIILDDTITSGIFVIRGDGHLRDTSGNQIFSGTWNGGVTILNEMSNPENNARAVWEYERSQLSSNKDTMGYWVSRKLLTLSNWLANRKRD